MQTLQKLPITIPYKKITTPSRISGAVIVYLLPSLQMYDVLHVMLVLRPIPRGFSLRPRVSSFVFTISVGSRVGLRLPFIAYNTIITKPYV